MDNIIHLWVEKPPEFLFHAVNEEESDQAFSKGLNRPKKGFIRNLKTTFPYVEMFETERDAKKQILKGFSASFIVMAGLMAEDGYQFFHAETGEWLADNVPAKYLRLC